MNKTIKEADELANLPTDFEVKSPDGQIITGEQMLAQLRKEQSLERVLLASQAKGTLQ